MRILHVSDCYLPRLGGIEVQVHSLAQHQLAAGHRVEVATATPLARHDHTGFELVEGVPVHRVSMDLPFELPVHPRVGREVAALVERAAGRGEAFDVAHVHTGVVSPFAYGAVPALLAAGLPTAVTVHSMWGPAAGVFRAVDLAVRWTRWPVAFSAVSAVAAAPLVRALRGRPSTALAGPAARVLVIPNGIEPSDWQVEPAQRPDDEVLLVAVMRLAPRKRCRPLLRMLHEVRQRVTPQVRLRAVIVGEGPERRPMQRYLDRQAMTWVELVGRWPRTAIRDLYRRADLFVSASDLESFGIAALEARTAGVPVIAKACTGATEFIVDGVDGVLAASDDDLVAGLVDLAVHPDRRRAIAAHNRAVPPAATWPQVLDRCDDAYAAARLIRSQWPGVGRRR